MAQDDPRARRATIEEAPAVAQLLHDFNTEFDIASPGTETLTARLRTLLAEDHTVALIAGDPAVAVALITLRSNVWFDEPVALLDELYVAPGDRDRGIGTTLVDTLVQFACDRGIELIEIPVDEGDAGARRFYERHGFSATEADTGEAALYYSRALTDST